jgi:Ni2+-binding GTPase involved in maturation of urease and hydrogenase
VWQEPTEDRSNFLEREIDDVMEENARLEELLVQEGGEAIQELPPEESALQEFLPEGITVEEAVALGVLPGDGAPAEEPLPEVLEDEIPAEEPPLQEAPEDEAPAEEPPVQEAADDEAPAPESRSSVEVDEVVAKASTKRMPFADDNGYMTSWKIKTANLPEIAMPDDLTTEEAASGETVIDHLTDEQKAIFSYFVPVKGMEPQLCQTLTGTVRHLTEDKTASTGNIIIQGGQGCGKTMLATSILKVLQKECGHPNGKVGKIDAQTLNQKDIQALLRKVAGGCLIIEHAGDLTRESAVTLSLLLAQDSSGILVILEDTTKGIRKALMQDDGFARKFTERVTVPIFTNDELVAFARAYAKELGYEIDEMAVLALYNRISNIQRLDQATTLTEVKEIVDEAIDREAHGGIKKAISILTAARYTEDDCIVLREKDFN